MSKKETRGNRSYKVNRARSDYSQRYPGHPVVPLLTIFAVAFSAISINSLAHLGDQDPGYVGPKPTACTAGDSHGPEIPENWAEDGFIYDVLDLRDELGLDLIDQSAHQPGWTFQGMFNDEVRGLDDASELLCTLNGRFVITRTGKTACEIYRDWDGDYKQSKYPALERFCPPLS